MGALLVARECALVALAGDLAANRKKEAAVAAPVCGNVGVGLKPVGDVVVKSILVVLVVVGLGDTFGEHLLVACFVAHVPAVLALVAVARHEELVAQGTEDDLEELLLNELVTVHLVDLALALLDGALTTETSGLERPTSNILLD